MDEITLDDKTYVSSKRAAQITGYAKDYVGQLCREGRVEARLVGRNWYVLESSIRNHRFGLENTHVEKVVETPVSSARNNLSTWETPNYMHEAFSALPKMRVQEKVEAVSPTPQETESAVTEMQDIWKDWFTREATKNLVTEGLLESPEVLESREELESPQEPEFEAVPLTRVTETVQHTKIVEENDDEVVQLHRSYSPTLTVEMPSVQRNVSPQAFTYAPQSFVPKQTRRTVFVEKKPSLILSALFLSIAGIAAVIAIIGTGKFDTIIGLSKIHYYPVQYLGGESSFTKNNK